MLWRIDPTSRLPLQEQIAGCVRRAVADGQLDVGDQLTPAAELAEALGVDRNTVLAGYRRLRDAGVLEFRRGRGARVASAGRPRASVEQAVRDLVELARSQGYPPADLIKIVEELA
jgi:DNA-binding transcriptional regulator YhcF (GntR family)